MNMRVKSLPKILRTTGLVVGVNYAAWATGQTYTIQQISLTGSTYTVGGTPSSSFAAAQTLTTGQVAGTTNRFPSGGGKDAWFYDPDTNTALEVGLYGPGYQSTVDAAQVSNIIADNSADDVIGYSNPYSGSTELGETSWEYFGSTGTTQIIGLYGAGYTQSGDYSYVIDQAMDSTGDAVGTSKRYDGTNLQVGTDAWYYSASTNSSQVIGFTGAGYNFTTADGAASETSAVKAMSSSGAAVGTSDRYSGSTSEGQDAWYYVPSSGTTTQIGLTGPTYQGAGGLANSSITAMSPSGMTVGTTTRYFGGSSGMGADAWLYNPTNNSNTQIGLTTANYQNGNVEQSSISAVNSLGQAAGTSFRYLSGTQIGQDAWFYNPTSNTTTAIGLTGSVYVSPTNSTRNSSISSLNTNGLVTGTSNRYDGSGNSLGSDAWLYNAATNTTMQIGLTGAGYVSSTGAETSFPSALSNTGLVGGFANRYNGATQEGQDGWVFDNNTDTTYTLDFSQNAAGSASTTISYISDSGIVVGSYIKYTGASSTTDAFEWTESGGFIDLNTAVPNLSAWSLLGQATRVSNSGQIVGYGTPAGETGTTAAVWVLTPIYQPASLTWTNASSDGLWNTASSANWNNGTGTTVFNATDNVTFNDANGGAGNYAVALNTTVSPGSVTVNNSSGNYAITGAGMIADAGSLTKLGSGTLTLGVATSASSVSINSGTVAIAPNVTLGSGDRDQQCEFRIPRDHRHECAGCEQQPHHHHLRRNGSDRNNRRLYRIRLQQRHVEWPGNHFHNRANPHQRPALRRGLRRRRGRRRCRFGLRPDRNQIHALWRCEPRWRSQRHGLRYYGR